jgi:8-oxo-dGTP pyrophosphatase MutT (NUDIX family)
MTTTQKPVRVSAKAIIIDAGEVLLLEMQGDGATYYVLPGGGQEPGESLPQALRRECAEEIGATVEVGDLILVRDYIEANHEFAYRKTGFHQVELMFRCTIVDRRDVRTGHVPDTRQTGFCWVPLSRLADVLLYPKCLAEELVRVLQGHAGSVYLGDVN